MGPRLVAVQDVLRYAQGSDQSSVELDGFLNYHYLTSPVELGLAKVMLESGINPTSPVEGPDNRRRPAIAIRSSPWKAGRESNPWHDEFDLDHGHVRYYGDHKPTTIGVPGVTRGNRALLEAWRFHSGVSEAERAMAPPTSPVPLHHHPEATVGRWRAHVEFCGAALIERLEYVVQRDPVTGRSFPNIVLDLAVVSGDESDSIDMAWIDDRRDPSLSVDEALRHAPESWRRWVREGKSAIPRVRRRVVSSRVKSGDDQIPPTGTSESDALWQIYRFFDDRKHAFELLAARSRVSC